MGSKNGAKGKRFRPRLYNITFPEDSPWADLEASIRGCSVGSYLNLLEAGDVARDAADGLVRPSEAERRAVDTIIAEFAPLIRWWNVEEVVTAGPAARREWAASLLEAHGAVAADEAVDDVLARVAALPPDGEDGEEVLRPVTPDEAGVRSQDFDMIMALYQAWQNRSVVVPPPLQNGSAPSAESPGLADIPVQEMPGSLSSS